MFFKYQNFLIIFITLLSACSINNLSHKNKLNNLSLHINLEEFYKPNTKPINAVTRLPQPVDEYDLESYYEIACSLLTIFAENCSVLQKYKRNIIWQNAVSKKN